MAVVDVRGVGVDNNDANDDDALLLRVPLGDKTWSGSIAITTESEQKQKREDEERVFVRNISPSTWNEIIEPPSNQLQQTLSQSNQQHW